MGFFRCHDVSEIFRVSMVAVLRSKTDLRAQCARRCCGFRWVVMCNFNYSRVLCAAPPRPRPNSFLNNDFCIIELDELGFATWVSGGGTRAPARVLGSEDPGSGN